MISVIKSVSAGQDIYGNVSELLYVNSFHHQAVNLTGKGIIVTARACDETIEAIELKDYPFGVGVQWHPECMFRTSPEMRTLFKNFVEHCSVSGE